MECDRCLICYTELQNCEEVGKTDLSASSPPILSKTLHNVFILKNLFEIPSEKLENYLVQLGNPSRWKFIRFCGSCEGVVKHIKEVYQEILETSRIFTELKGEIVENVRRSWRKFEGDSESEQFKLSGRKSASKLIVQETRKFVCEHYYGPTQDPYKEGDLLATTFCSPQVNAQPSWCSQEEEMIKIEVNNDNDIDTLLEFNACDEDYMEEQEQEGSEVDDEEWVVGEVLQPEFNMTVGVGRFSLPPNEMIEINPIPSHKPPPKIPKTKPLPKMRPIPNIKPIPSSTKSMGSSINQNPSISNVKPFKSNKPIPKIKPILSSSSSSAIRKSTSENLNYRPKNNAPSMNKIFLQEDINNLFILPEPQVESYQNLPSLRVSSPPLLKCDYPGCDLGFAKMSMLTIHKRRHTGDKPFQCPWEGCTWRFIRKDELTRHYRTHTGVKPFKCPFCTKDFLRSDHCRKHVRSVHKMST